MENKSNPKISLSDKIKDIVKETALSSTSHGIPNIVRSPYLILKIFWTLCLIGSAGLCIYLSFSNLMNYLDFNVITTIREINEFPSIFPTVTVCNANRFTTDYALDYLRKMGKENFLPDIFDKQVYANLTDAQRDSIAFQYLVVGYGNIYRLNKTEKLKLSYQLNEVMLDCKFVFENCSLSDFVLFDDPYYGNCYMYNSGKNSSGDSVPFKEVSRSNTYESLKISFFMGVPDNLGIISSSSGLVVFVHNSSTSPMSLTPLIFAGDGTEAQIAVSRTFTSRLPSPYSQCNYNEDESSTSSSSSKSELFQMIKSFGYDYSQTDCINQCYQMFSIKNCSCVNFFFPSIFETKPCKTVMQFKCVGDFYKVFKKENFIAENCFPLCPLECGSKKYSTTISALRYPQYRIYQRFNKSSIVNKLYHSKNISTSLESNIVSLNIYLDKLTYTQIEEAAALDFVSFLSNLGGTAGLFLGISVLSIVEIFDALIAILIELFNFRKKQNVDFIRVEPRLTSN